MGMIKSHRKGLLVNDSPPQRKFGYEFAMERKRIQEELIAAGFDGNQMQLAFEVIAEQTRRHANDPTLRERQDATRKVAKARELGMGYDFKPALFSSDELLLIGELTENANSALGMAIHKKVRDWFDGRGTNNS